jgi:hypothetical protein
MLQDVHTASLLQYRIEHTEDVYNTNAVLQRAWASTSHLIHPVLLAEHVTANGCKPGC